MWVDSVCRWSDLHLCDLCPPQVANLQAAGAHYDWIMRYHAQHREAVEGVFGEEVALCKEMVDLLPHKLAQLQ